MAGTGEIPTSRVVGTGQQMIDPVDSPFLVPDDGSFRIDDARTSPPKGAPGRKEARSRLARTVEEISELQRVLYADDRYAVLLIFQAMDAAGKDGTIRAVTSGVNPAGFQVFSFKAPTPEELDHDFLWRTARCLPERGRIGIFNRSYYEEVLVVRVHDELLDAQRLPHVDRRRVWEQRFESIRDHERHLARNGVVLVKFWLNVSKREQRRRFIRRIDKPEKNWKFSVHDVEERGHWKAYARAYEEALAATSRRWAPWYAIPADDKPRMRLWVAEIIRDRLKTLDLRFPELDEPRHAQLAEMRAKLEAE